ncbi:transcriptional regulator [Vibrio cholerae]|uniref:Mor transcription activator family protein n=1 Tax=Vibrio cholerae TaxID=666 RepID=UPI002FDC0291
MLAIERAIPLVVDALSKDSGLFSFDDLESGDALYPELLSDVHDIFLGVIEDAGIEDNGLALHLVFKLMEYGNGVQFYLPKPDSIVKTIIKKMMKNDFNGSNYVELAKRYQCSTNYVRRVINGTH